MVEYKLKNGKLSVVKAKDIKLKENLISRAENIWNKADPESYIVNISLKRPAYFVRERSGIPVIVENQNITFYNICGNSVTEALEEVKRDVNAVLNICYHPIFLEVVEDALKRARK
jgi:hypothetical protein